MGRCIIVERITGKILALAMRMSMPSVHWTAFQRQSEDIVREVVQCDSLYQVIKRAERILVRGGTSKQMGETANRLRYFLKRLETSQ